MIKALFLFFTYLFLPLCACHGQDTTGSYFLQLIGSNEFNRIASIPFPNDTMEISFFDEHNDTIPVTDFSKQYQFPDKSTLVYHDSLFSGSRKRVSVWELGFRLAVDGPHYVGMRVRNKISGEWMAIKCFCAQPSAGFGTRESPWVQQFENGTAVSVNEVSFSSPGMPVSMQDAIRIAKKKGCFKMHFAWEVEDIRYNAEFRTWIITSSKMRETRWGECRHTNGCTILHYCTIRISAETGEVLNKSRGHGKTRNYE